MHWMPTVLLPVLCVALASGSGPAVEPQPPEILTPNAPLGIVQTPDGSFSYFNRRKTSAPTTAKTSRGTEITIEPHVDFTIPTCDRLGQRLVMDHDGELHEIIPRRRGEGRRIAVDRFIDIWHRKTTGNRGRWEPAKRIWEGYTGAVLMFTQLPSGRLVVPFARWIGGQPLGPPVGANVVTVVYSDDGGGSWRQSDAALTAPCFEGYNGSNLGACEPVIVPLRGDRIWMLMRTQTGFLYEAWSTDAVHWDRARPSRFHSSTGPPGILRLADGRLVLFWNNCEMPPRIDGQGVYGGRDALHAAISADQGRTWRGFREVYRDAHRNKTPPRRGDRGTAYPFPSTTRDGKILLLTGQGEGRRNFVLIDPDWLEQTHQEDDFSLGLDDWHIFKSFGPAEHWWRDRTVGATLVDHPTRSEAKALWLRKSDEHAADGATWNFPLGWKGTLTLSLLLKRGFAGGSIALADRMFEPCDDNGLRLSVFRLPIHTDGRLSNGLALEHDRWHTVTLQWDLSAGVCRVRANGQEAVILKPQVDTGNGLCYLRLRSTATDIDNAGMLIERVSASIDAPVAPVRNPEQNQTIAQQHEELMRGHRNKKTLDAQ